MTDAIIVALRLADRATRSRNPAAKSGPGSSSPCPAAIRCHARGLQDPQPDIALSRADVLDEPSLI
jgi:hypothetical protein